jgi:Family of unknown function (DUF6527)
MQIKLQRVHFMPKDLNPGVLYVSEEFGAAAHLCPCGCGSKIRTPLGPTEWSLEETASGPTLRPSVGNWQQTCQSHYMIWQGEIIWCEKWTPEVIAAGRFAEEKRRRAYYSGLDQQRGGIIQRIWRWIINFFKK